MLDFAASNDAFAVASAADASSIAKCTTSAIVLRGKSCRASTVLLLLVLLMPNHRGVGI